MNDESPKDRGTVARRAGSGAVPVLLEKGTEAPFTGEYDHTSSRHLPLCGLPVRSSSVRGEVRLGLRLAAFYAPAARKAIDEDTDTTYGMCAPR